MEASTYAAEVQEVPSEPDAVSVDNTVSSTGDENTLDSNVSSRSGSDADLPARGRHQRPKLLTRKSSGTLIVPRDAPDIERTDEYYGPGDARAMSPRRNSEEVDKLEEGARQALIEQAKELQATLMSIVERVESVKSEHEKLEGGNQFLQSYIGELMQTSKITSTAGKGKPRVRGGK